MMKFFRKYNKQLLALFMVLLMIVFVGGSALDRLLQPRMDRVVATSRLGDIGYSDQASAEAATRILEALGLNWKYPFHAATKPLELVDWILLTREAQRYAMGPEVATVRSALGGQSQIDQLARNMRRKPAQIVRAMAQLDAVQRAAQAVGNAAIPSEAEIRTAARNVLEKVRIHAVVLPASLFLDRDTNVSEAELQEQFSEFREREPGPGLEFGYYVPPAIKLQYIRIDRDVIAEQLRATKRAHLETKARSYYNKNRESDMAFRREPREQGSNPLDRSLEPDRVGPPEPRFLNWEAAKDIAIEIVAEKEADRAADRLASWLLQPLTEAWFGAEREPDGYKKTPKGVTELKYYDDILGDVPNTIAYPQAVSVETTDFFGKGDEKEVPGIGKAAFRSGQGTTVLSLPGLAFRTKVIIPEVPKDESSRASDYLALYQTCRYPLTDPDGNVYIFRVVDGRKGHVPDSLDEVRDRVTADVRLRHAYETATTIGKSLEDCLGSSTLKEAYEGDPQLTALQETHDGDESGYFEPAPFARASEYQAARGKLGSRFTDDLTQVPGLGLLSPEVVEGCFALEYAPEPVALFELKDRATILVVKWVETQRPDAEAFAAMRERFVQQMSRSRAQAAITQWLDPDNIRARNQFALVTN